MKKNLAVWLIAAMLLGLLPVQAAPAPETDTLTLEAPSALLMERETGEVLFEKNAHEKLRPASVTKVMTLLLLTEALDAGTISMDTVFTASEKAASMGGSQVYLEPGESLTLDEVFKCIAVASANDVCVMAAEHLAGSEESFVARMNEKAAELGMQDTHFANCTGLDAEGHVTTAYDIALMSRALLSHDVIRQYTGIWMDSIRGGTFGLTNTNKLVRFYRDATGLKTGFTDTAGYCISASAQRDGMELIAVVMHAETSPKRNADAAAMLDYGFARYALLRAQPLTETQSRIPVTLGETETVQAQCSGMQPVVVEKSRAKEASTEVQLQPKVEAPVEAGQILGTCRLKLGDTVLSEAPVTAAEAVSRKTAGTIYRELLQKLFLR